MTTPWNLGLRLVPAPRTFERQLDDLRELGAKVLAHPGLSLSMSVGPLVWDVTVAATGFDPDE